MKNNRIFPFILLQLFLTSCSVYHINTDDNIITLKHGNKILLKNDIQIKYMKKIRLINISIYQYIYELKRDHHLIVVEDAIVSGGYRFRHGIKRTIYSIFPDYAIEHLKVVDNLYFFKLSDRKETLYLIVENFNKKRLKLIYGINKNEFYNILNSIQNNSKILNYNTNNMSSNVQINIKTKWSFKNIILDTIITKDSIGKMKR